MFLRYAPYPMAPGVPAQLQAVAAAQLQQQQQQHQAPPASSSQQQPQTPQMNAPNANPYPGYNLAGVDMSGFNGLDWSSMYGMNMYV